MKEASRDARGLAIADAAVRDLKFTLRSFRRAPLTGLTIVFTVGLGLGLVAAVFTVLNAFVFRPDDVRNPHELVGIVRPQPGTSEPEPSFTPRLFDALLRETDIFAEAFATTPDVDAWIDGQRREGRLVTGNFFQVLGVSAARGRGFTPPDDEPGRTPVIVLSHRAWSQHFAGDPDIVHRSVRVNGTTFQVVGVMPESFRGLELASPDYWAPLAAVRHFRRDDAAMAGDVPVDIIGRLAPGLAPGQALAQVQAWDARHRPPSAGEIVERLVIEPRMGTIPLSFDTLVAFTPLFFAFGLILLIGCANVANLLHARGIARQREIGVRLAIGASRRRVIAQLLIESLSLALVSAVLAFGISRLVLEGIVHALVSTFPPGMGNLRLAVPEADWRVGLFLLAGALASTVSFGLAPALQTTRLDLVHAIRGEAARARGPGRPRRALVVVQVTASALLLISAAIFLRSSWSAAQADSGIRTEGIITIGILDEERRRTVLDIVRGDPTTTRIAAAWPGLVGGRPAAAEGAAGPSAITYQFVSPEYFPVLGVDIVRGRGFAADEDRANTAVAVVSESVARQLWPSGDAVGQALRLGSETATDARNPEDPPSIAGILTVVGVARDVAGFRIGAFRARGAGVYVPIAPEAAGTTLLVAARGDAGPARARLIERMASVDPNLADIDTLETLANAEAYLLAIPFWLTLALGALALLLTLSGLFSVLSYLVEQRTGEIGVRMALGATRGRVASLVLSELARPVGLGLLLGSTLTSAIGRLLLSTSAAEAIGEAVRLFDPLAFAGSLLCIVAACIGAALVPAWRAARISPLLAIRWE